MILKYLSFGKAKLYVFPDEDYGKNQALLLCRALGYKFYPSVIKTGRTISSECYNGYLLKEEKIKENSICTVCKKLYDTLEFKTEEINIPLKELQPENVIQKEKIQSIHDKKLVFIAGRGIGNKANYERLKKLAEKFNASIGCTRPVAMNGWESYDNFVGISGNILKSDMVVCFGVSGSTPFLKGIENCKTIIAINNDKNALIFKTSDYGIFDDCLNIISYLEKK